MGKRWRWDDLSPRQVAMVRRFAESGGFSVSQATKYLDECFRLAKGQISEKEFTNLTGHAPHKIRFTN